MPDNLKRQDEIAKEVIEKYFTPLGYKAVTVGELLINDFSSVFWMEPDDATGKEGIFVKIPKIEITKASITDISEEDRVMAREEYRSLVYLSKHWDSGEMGIGFVQPLMFLKNWNVVVTKRIYGEDLLHSLIEVDSKSGADDRKGKYTRWMHSIGGSVASLHRVEQEQGIFDIDGMTKKLESHFAALQRFNVPAQFLTSVLGRVKSGDYGQLPCRYTQTLKGLDIRNLLLKDNGEVAFLDPGKLKRDCVEAELGRFIVTIKIVYWGTLRFFLHQEPDRKYISSFLSGYYGEMNPTEKKLLALFTIKDLTKHWHMAHKALELKCWSAPFKFLLKKLYIDSFYKNAIKGELATLCSLSAG